MKKHKGKPKIRPNVATQDDQDSETHESGESGKDGISDRNHNSPPKSKRSRPKTSGETAAPQVVVTREESSLFFRLVTRRYERTSTILTSNKSFSDWGEIFGDQVIATAILDRLLHHATTINIKGKRL